MASRGSGPKGGGAGAAGSGADSTHGGNTTAGGMFGGVNTSTRTGGFSHEGVFTYGPEGEAGFGLAGWGAPGFRGGYGPAFAYSNYGMPGVIGAGYRVGKENMGQNKPTSNWSGKIGTAVGVLAGLATGNPAVAALAGILGRLAVGKLEGKTAAESTGPFVAGLGITGPLQAAGGYVGGWLGDAPGGILGQKIGGWAANKIAGMTPTADDTSAFQTISDNEGGPKFLNWSRRLS